MTNKLPNELTIDVAALHGLLVDLAATAASDDALPMLNGVLLHTDTTAAGQRVLVGTSTDRFLLGQAHARAIGEFPETFLPLHGVRTLITALAAWYVNDDDYDEDEFGDPIPVRRSAGPPAGRAVQLTRIGDRLTLTFDDVSVHVTLRRTEFPTRHLPGLFAEATSVTTVSVQPTMWRTLERIADRRGSVITMTVQTPEKPAQVHIGSQYRALVMPYRASDVETTPPVFLPPSSAPPAGTVPASPTPAQPRRADRGTGGPLISNDPLVCGW